MIAWYLPSCPPPGNVPDKVDAVIGVWAAPMIVSKVTPSRCSAACHATKSGSVAEVPISSTLMSIRGSGAAAAAPGIDMAPITAATTARHNQPLRLAGCLTAGTSIRVRRQLLMEFLTVEWHTAPGLTPTTGCLGPQVLRAVWTPTIRSPMSVLAPLAFTTELAATNTICRAPPAIPLQARKVRSVGRVESKPQALEVLAASMSSTDRVALEVTGSCCENVRILEPHVAQVVVVSPSDTGISNRR